MKRLIIATALFAAVAVSFGQPATMTTDVAKGVFPGGPWAKGSIPNFPRTDIELPETDVLQQQWAKGAIPSGPWG